VSLTVAGRRRFEGDLNVALVVVIQDFVAAGVVRDDEIVGVVAIDGDLPELRFSGTGIDERHEP